MRQVNNERERNILREEEDQIGKEPIRWRRRGKERGKKEKEKRRKKKKNSAWERKRKRERRKEKIFPMFRRSELDSPRPKVGPRNESYAWVPKSEFFVEAPRGRGFSYIGYFLPSGHVRAILVQL